MSENVTFTAKELRQQAFELLAQAEKIDGCKPHIAVCTGGYDEPTMTILWSSKSVSAKDVAEHMGLGEDEVEGSDYEFYNRAVSLVEYMPPMR